MEIDPKILSACPEDPELAVAFLREAGLSKVESIKAMHDRFGLTLAEAKALAHVSPAWADRRENDDALHERLSAPANAPPKID